MPVLWKMPECMSPGCQYPECYLPDATRRKKNSIAMKFDLFVMPFTAGLFFFWAAGKTYAGWFRKTNKADRSKVIDRLFQFQVFRGSSGKFSAKACCIRRIFNKNRLLGFMHMSLAFGWFLLIMLAILKAGCTCLSGMNPPYLPIFFRFFHAESRCFSPAQGIFVSYGFPVAALSFPALCLPLAKRIYSKAYGMKGQPGLCRETVLPLTALWLIFPLRLLAESFTSALGRGRFPDCSTLDIPWDFSSALNCIYPAWWAYSLSLGIFLLPFLFQDICIFPPKWCLFFQDISD